MMDDVKHTPGPWKVGNGDVYVEGDKSSDFDDIIICAIGRGGGFRSHEYAVVKANKPEGKANTHLIAAAPELLEALVWAVDHFDGNTRCNAEQEQNCIEKCRAAVAKATGAA